MFLPRNIKFSSYGPDTHTDKGTRTDMAENNTLLRRFAAAHCNKNRERRKLTSKSAFFEPGLSHSFIGFNCISTAIEL